MTADLRQRLKRLLSEYAANGAGPFEVRAKKRGLRPEALTDIELRHNLLNAYGPLLNDLDRLGLSRFYRMDLAAVVGRTRVDRVLSARYTLPPPRARRSRRRDAGWLLGGVSSMLVASGVIGFGIIKDDAAEEVVTFGMTTPIWSAVYQADQTPPPVLRSMRHHALKHLGALPVGSDLWWALKGDPAVPTAVRQRMERDLQVRNRIAVAQALGPGGEPMASTAPGESQ